MKKNVLPLLLMVLILSGVLFNYSKANLSSKGEIREVNINYPCAVILNPSLKKIDKLKSGTSEDEFLTIVDDNIYYMSLVEEYLDSVKCKRVRKDSEGEVIFKTSNDKTFKINVNGISWGVLLFNGIDKPIEADLTDINKDYENYMKKVK